MPNGHAWPPASGAVDPEATTTVPKGDLKMKQFLIVLTLVVASAAPAMAVEFNKYTVSAFGR
jgi:hypothetical protein